LGVIVGNPLFSEALVRERARRFEGEPARHRPASEQVTAHLSSVRFFASCGKKELRSIAKAAKIASMHRGTQIITEGDEANTMYVILDGTARVSRGGRRLATIGPGDAFGELALLSKGPRTASVVATSDMEVAIITRHHLSGLLETAPAFSRKLIESLADRMRELDKKLV
jgi:CRP-like cAMP-binding protein